MPSAVAKGVALLVLFGGVSPAAGQNNVFANKAALQTGVVVTAISAEALPPLDEPSSSPSADSTVLGPHKTKEDARASHGRELQSSGCRSDICGDGGNDCCAPGSDRRSCRFQGYVVTAGGTSSRGDCLRLYGQSAIYQCCPASPPPPPPGQNNVFANRAALLVARDAWCADPTAAAAIYGPINLWDISQVTDLSGLFMGTVCASFNSDISGWDVSRVTTLAVRAASPPLHPSPLTRMLCLAFAYRSLCRVQYAFYNAWQFNQPLEAWDVSRVTGLQVRAASCPLHPSPLTRTRCASLLLTIRFAECSLPSVARLPSTNPLRRGMSRASRMARPPAPVMSRGSRMVALTYAPPLILSPASPPPHHTAMASLLSPSSSPIGSSPPISHTLSSSPPSDSTGHRWRSAPPTL